jgi:ribosomal protein S18 acetylase RimI-like enzyme
VLPTTQGKGVGKHLLELTSEIALEAKNTTLTLNVNRYNKAIEFYKKIGFEIIGQENIDVGQGFLMEDYIL